MYAKSEDVDLENLLIEIFITNGRLLHHERILSFFPKYLEQNFYLMNSLLNEQSVLPRTHAYYLSIMAISCYDCKYLLKA